MNKDSNRSNDTKEEQKCEREIRRIVIDEVESYLQDNLMNYLQNVSNNKYNYINFDIAKVSKYDFINKKYKLVNKDLKQFIKNSPYSQLELSEILKVSDKTLSNIVNNRHNPSLELAYKMCILINKTIEDVFYFVEMKD